MEFEQDPCGDPLWLAVFGLISDRGLFAVPVEARRPVSLRTPTGIKASIVILSNLSVAAIVDGKLVSSKAYSHIIPPKDILGLFSQLLNLMAEVKSWIADEKKVPWISLSADCLETFLRNASDDE